MTHKLLPAKPTEAMVNAAMIAMDGMPSVDEITNAYRAMFDAAPETSGEAVAWEEAHNAAVTLHYCVPETYEIAQSALDTIEKFILAHREPTPSPDDEIVKRVAQWLSDYDQEASDQCDEDGPGEHPEAYTQGEFHLDDIRHLLSLIHPSPRPDGLEWDEDELQLNGKTIATIMYDSGMEKPWCWKIGYYRTENDSVYYDTKAEAKAALESAARQWLNMPEVT